MTGMGTMNISLPESMKDFVDAQVAERGFGTSSEYVRELIRREQDRCRLRDMLVDGANSSVGEPAAPPYFDALRDRIRQRPDK
jgi:antitoxin ParD1/3/4